jgi:rhamnogalacturonyl hydrolase YesR
MASQDLLSVGIFAAQSALRSEDRDLLEFAARQPTLYSEKLRDPISGLYHQVWLEGLGAPQNQGDGFNLRVNGQVLYALVVIAESLPIESPARPPVVEAAVDLQGRILAHQLPSGGFPLGVGSRYQEEEEVSTSAWIGAALARGVRSGVLPSSSLEQARDAWSYLVARVGFSRSAGALPLYDISPIARQSGRPDRLVGDQKNTAHGVGPVLLLAAELQALGGL